MNVLIACEESQAVCTEFRRGGTEHFLVTYKSAPAVIPSGTSKEIVCR